MPLNVFARLMPREESFTALFCEQTRCIVRAAHELLDLMDHKGPADAHVSAIRAIEVTADSVARKVFLAANRVFNAPIDREDIMALAHVLDDCVDLIEDAAKEIQRYGILEFPPEMLAMADAVVEASAVLRKVMPYLDTVGKDHKTIIALCEEVGAIEDRADASFDQGLTRLRAQLKSGEIDTIGYVDRKEIYEIVEDVVDKCDDVANAIQSITAKHA